MQSRCSDNGLCILEQRCPSPQILDAEAYIMHGHTLANPHMQSMLQAFPIQLPGQ